MKKLSKILVIVLTLAMLLGVVVVSASASDKAADVLDEKGDIIASYDSIYDAIDAANGNTEKGDVTVKINKNVTLSKAVTITRDAEEYGKVIIDLNGYTLTTDATNTYTALGTVVNGGSSAKGAGKIVPYIYIKADKDATPKAYMLEGFAFAADTAATDLDGNPVTVSDLVAGETYIGTVSVAKNQSYALPTLTFKRGALNVGADASLEVAGNGGQITRKASSNVFHIESDAEGAELYVHDLTIPGTAAAYVVQVNNGVATFDNVYLYSNDNASIIRHGGGEINIKNSYLYMLSSSSANVAMIRTQGTNAEKAADGYHIEITNTTMVCASYVFASAHTEVSACSTAYSHVKPTSDSTQKTFYAPHDVPVVGETYVNTDFLVENSNVEVVNYQGRARSDNTGLVGFSGFMNFDFKKTNILISQRGIGYGLTATADPGVFNFYDCYIELTGKGNLNNAMNATFVGSTSSAIVNFYYTEFAVSDTYEKNGNPKGNSAITPDTLFPGYANVNFYVGCKFDKTSAPTSNNLKARISGGKYLTNDAGDLIVTGIDYVAAGVDGLLDFTENDMEALNPATTGTAFNPIVILSGGNKLTNAGADTTSRQMFGEISAKAWNLYVAQGIQKVGVDADGNKYSYWDPHYVKNDMADYTYTAADAFSGVTLPADVTAAGGWDIDKDGVIEYLDTDDNDNDAEYVNIAKNGAGYSWTAIPDSYEKNYVSGSSPYFTIGAKSFYAPEYQYVTYSFDYKTADDSDYFVPIRFGVQGRREFGNSGDSGSQLTKIMSNGDVYVNNTKSGKTLNPDAWNNITLLMEIKETVVADGAGHYVDKTNRGNISFKNSVIHVFVNGEKAGSYASGFNDAHGWIVNLRGALESDAAGFTNGAQMCIDNVRNVGYLKGYQSSELDALLSGKETDLDTWSASIFNLHDKYEVSSLPEAKAPVASLTITPPVANEAWASYSSTTDTTRYETEVRATTLTFDSIEDAIAHGGYGNKIAHVGYTKLTVELLAGGEKIFVDAPANIKTNGNEITYYSSEYKGTLNEETGILSFTRATAADLIEVTYDYADGEGVITETFIKGGSFWFDLDRIPTLLKKFDLENARDLKLAFNGELLGEFDPADFAAAQVISESNNTFVFSYEIEKQYGWMIYDLAGDFSGLSSDIGETYAELADRIRLIEKFWDPFANDTDEETKDIPDVVLSGSVYVPNPELYSLDENAQNLRTNGYTIKLFKDFTDAERIYALNSTAASKTVNYDLNGHTVTYTDGLIFAYGAEVAWEIDTATGKVLEYHGSRMNGTMPTTKQNVKVKSDSPKFATVLSYTKLYVNVISSEPGAKIISSGSTALVSSDRQEKVNCANTAGATGKFQPITSYQSPQVVLGNAVAASHTDIGPDANVIDIVAPLVYYVFQYDTAMLNCVQNVNVISDKADGMLAATNARHSIKNCNFIYTNAKGDGLLTTGTGTILFTVTKCNFISLSETNLFAKAGGRVQTSSQYVDFSNSRFYNVALDSASIPSWSSAAVYTDAYDEVITFGLDCYYNIKFAPKWNHSLKSDGKTVVEIVPFRLAASREQTAAQYQANVYVNETVSINGVDYTFTYKVAKDSDIVSVNWADKEGVVFATDKYVNGAQLVYDKASTKYDDITRSKYVYENLGVATPDLTVNAAEIKLIPGFAVKTNLNLETNFKHNIKIFRYVTDVNGNLVDAFANVTSVSIGGQVVELALNLGEDEKAGTADDYYYYTVNVKSNAILDTYDLVINFNALDGTPVTVEQTLSVTKYLEQGFAAEIYGGDLYNMYASIVNYGIASYKNFAETAVGDVAALEALANKYPANVVELPKAEAGAAGENLDVEFVLDEKLEYRFYLTGIGADFMDMNNITITYTNIEGATITKKYGALESDGVNYWVDFTVPAYNFLADINIVVDNSAAGVYADVTYNLASYYADVQGSEAELIALTEALYNYAYYANAYMLNK